MTDSTLQAFERGAEIMAGYNVYLIEDGSDEEYVGYARTLREARHLAAVAGRTGRTLPRSLYETARAAGHCAGLRAPEGQEAEEPIEWCGRGGVYAIVPVLAERS